MERPSAELGTIHQLSLKDQVYRRLRDAIAEGVLAPGDRLVEQELAEQLGVSRTPVREALQKLANEGLVSMLPRRGVVVESLSADDVDEIFRIREVLEGLAGYLAATRADEAVLAHMDAIVAESAAANQKGDEEAVVELNRRFHELVVAASKSARLEELIHIVLSQISHYRQMTMTSSSRRDAAVPEHKKIVEALRRRDPADAEACLREHARNARRTVMELLRNDTAR